MIKITTTKIYILGLACVLGASLQTPAAYAQPGKARKNTVLYKLKAGASVDEQNALTKALGDLGIRSEKMIAHGKVNFAKIHRQGSLTEGEVAQVLMATGGLEFAEPDALVEPEMTPNDPYVGNQWQHAKIGSYAAWDKVPGGSQSVLVAVCDSGVESTHPDLAPNMALPGYNTVDNTTNSEPNYSAASGGYHGTMVAGYIAAAGNNGAGVAGVAYGVKILPVKITNQADSTAYSSDAAECITYAADRGAKVVNLSYLMGRYATIDSAAQYLRTKNGLLFVAAGNGGCDTGSTCTEGVYPDYSSFVLVGATDQNDLRAGFSNYGAAIDIVAPGVGVYSTYWNGGYTGGNGTSFASPITAGAAALLYSINPGFTSTQVENFLFSTANRTGGLSDSYTFGNGRVDAAAAVNKALSTAGNIAPSAMLAVSATSGAGPLTVQFDGSRSSDMDGMIMSYSWKFGDGATATGAAVSHVYNSVGNFTAVLTVTDDMGASSSVSQVISVQDTQAPTTPSALTAKLSSTVAKGRNKTATVTVSLSWGASTDNVGVAKYAIYRNGVLIANVSSTSYTDNSTAAGGGMYTYQVKAIDAGGNTSALSNSASVSR